jgi:hypothetical protein
MPFVKVLFAVFFISLFSCYSNPGSIHNSINYSDIISSQKVIRDIGIDIFNKNIAILTQGIKDEIVQNNGEIIQESIENINLYRIIVKMHRSRIVNFIEKVNTLGIVVNGNINSSGNMETYIDNYEMQLRNIKSMLGRYNELLKNANTITDILTMEKEINIANMEMERIERSRMEMISSLEYVNVSIAMRNK